MNRSLVRPAACALAAAAFTLILLAVPASSPSAQTITLTGFGCSGTVGWNSTTNTLICQTSGGTFDCSISASPSSAPLLTQAVTLTASCSSAAGTVNYTWTPGANPAGCPGITQEATVSKADLALPTALPAGACTYNLSASDGTTTVTPTKTVSYSTAPPPPPPGGVDTSACTALGLNPKVITAAWTGNTVLYTSSAGNFGPNDAVIVQFTTSSVTTSTSSGSISAVQYVDPDTSRSFVLSDKPCDFTGGLNLYKLKLGVVTQCKNGDGSAQKSAGTGQINPQNGFTVANAGGSCNPILDAGRTYFWSLTNFSPPPGVAGSTQQCNLSHCNMIMFLTKPTGT